MKLPLTPVEVTVPPLPYFVVEGQGDPNGPDFQQAVEALYALAYGVRMAPKNKLELAGWVEFKVFPLEGVWDLIVPESGPVRLDNLKYRAMIRQPDFLDEAAAAQVLAAVRAKKKLPRLAGATFERLADGRCVEMLHLGPFANEPSTFLKMRDFCRKESLARVGKTHREIYLSDPRKTEPDKLKTLLRFPVRDDYSCI
ncbi:MAG: GyrI-like domain-containing protein [Spirochaetales bacterium]